MTSAPRAFSWKLGAGLLAIWIALGAAGYVLGWPPIVSRFAAGAVALVWLAHGTWVSRIGATPWRNPKTGRFSR